MNKTNSPGSHVLMVSECKICHTPLSEEQPQINGICMDCFADKGGELIEQPNEYNKEVGERLLHDLQALRAEAKAITVHIIELEKLVMLYSGITRID